MSLLPQITSFPFWRYRSYLLLQIARFQVMIGLQMLNVAVGWHVYEITGRALDLGFVGLSLFLPTFVFSLWGGDLADRYNRVKLIVAAYACLILGGVGLSIVGQIPELKVWWIYLLLMCFGVARAFGGPASSALVPTLVPKHQLVQAVALGSSTFQVAAISGPALGGILYGLWNQAIGVYYLCSCLFISAFLLMLFVRVENPLSAEQRSKAELVGRWQRLKVGLAFVWHQKIILGAISLDLFAVLLGGAVALLPIYARDILSLGPQGLGLLRSAPAMGAAIVAILSIFYPMRRHVGMRMFWAVFIFGVCTCVFAVSTSLWLSMLALVILGAVDMISVVIRHTLVQSLTPNHMRGRVSSVNQVFIGASNELGEFESGLTAHWFGVINSVLIGGFGTILVVLGWKKMFPGLFRMDQYEVARSEENLIEKQAH